MEAATGIGDVIQTYGVATAALIGLTICVVYLFKYIKEQNAKQDEQAEKHANEMKDMTNKYYESYIKVTESNARVSEALNNNTRVIERLLDRMDKE